MNRSLLLSVLFLAGCLSRRVVVAEAGDAVAVEDVQSEQASDVVASDNGPEVLDVVDASIDVVEASIDVVSTEVALDVSVMDAAMEAAVDVALDGVVLPDGGFPAGRSIAASGTFVCAIKSDRTVVCWGSNEFGQLGRGSTTAPTMSNALPPAPVVGITDAVEIAVGPYHACARRAAGGVLCWGRNDRGQLGVGDLSLRSSPAMVPNTLDVVELALGGLISGTPSGHTCVRRASGRVTCWGDNSAMQLGQPSAATSMMEVPMITNAVSLRAGGTSNCAILATGELFCWGSNARMQANPSGALLPTGPVRIDGIGAIQDVQVGPEFSCVLQTSGEVVCWGGNAHRLWGANPAITRGVSSIAGVTGATAIAVSENHACAQTATTLLCWGVNDYGQLGTGDATTTTVSTLREVSLGTRRFTELALGYSHSCGRGSDGAVLCWGRNASGQLGARAPMNRGVPATVAGITGDVEQVAPQRWSTCARTRAGQVYCWGDNLYVEDANGARVAGQLGDETRISRGRATLVSAVSGATSLASADVSSCALTMTGGMVWGFNDHGQLGDGTTTTRGEPHALMNAMGFTSVSGGVQHYCALRGAAGSASLWCWGNGSHGGLGINDTADQLAPVAVMWSASDVWSVAAGEYFTCAIRGSERRVWCWGQGRAGQTGDSARAMHLVPFMTTVTNARAISLGTAHACVIDEGTRGVSCWGRNDQGQLAENPLVPDRSGPTPVSLMRSGTALRVQSIALGGNHSCALTEDGKVWCWGDNSEGQLGINFVGSNRSVPTEVPTLANVVGLWAGYNRTCALVMGTSGTELKCWGSDTNGALGDDTVPCRVEPTEVRLP